MGIESRAGSLGGWIGQVRLGGTCRGEDARGELDERGRGVQRSLGGRYEAGMRRIEASGIVAGG
jgi:hypothetical protein